jgi:L-alanine-DL-glutamate epimerase-like enolase superfamily enzyme
MPKIVEVETHCLSLPYRKAVKFKRGSEAAGQYIVLRLLLDDGTEGIAESNTRPDQNGEDARAVAYRIQAIFKPRLIGADPTEHQRILAQLEQTRHCRTEKALIDVALWDLRGKLAGLPVWKLLGGGPAKAIPLTWIAHGDTTDAMIEEAKCKALDEGYKGLKLKVWKRSEEDIRMVREVRSAVGDKFLIYVDANGVYSETEARTILGRLGDYDVALIEEPCNFPDARRGAEMARALPIALLGDQNCESLTEVANLVALQAVGAVSVKLRRTGITESLKIIALCEAFGLPVVIGTDSESRIGAKARFHLYTGVASLSAFPAETHFFEKLADDAFRGDFQAADGEALPGDKPGFGVALDPDKVAKYAMR